MVFALVPQAAFAAGGTEAEAPGTAAAEPAETRDAEGAKATKTKTVLTFTSDIHNASNNTAANRLNTWLGNVISEYGGIDVMSFCGDMGSASSNESQFWTYTQAVVDVVNGKSIPGVYTTGNHEFYNGQYSSTSNSVKGIYKVGVEGLSGTNYHIYCLGTDNWNNNKDNYTTGQITALTNYLNSVTDGRPIIVLTHFPLHRYSSRQSENADKVIDALNNAANAGKKIVLLWGHNHTMSDTNYDEIFEPGRTITYDSSGNSKTISFFYAAAGCMSDTEYSGSGSAYVKGKGLVITIDNSNKLSFTYYNANGEDVTEGGTYTEQDPVPIESASIDQGTVTGEGGVPMVEETLPAGKTLQLTYSKVPADATVKSITWTSNNTAVATVEETTGKVKGVSEGTAKITATLSDGITRGQVVAEVLVNVGPRGAGPMYVLTDTLAVGKNYIIANKNTGEAYALTNNNGSRAKTAVEIDGDTISLDEVNEAIVFTTEGSGTTVSRISNNGYYLSPGNNSLSLTTTAPSNTTWAYGTDNKLTVKSGNTTYYLYYSTYSGGNFSGSTSGSSTSSPREVYLFEEVVAQVDVDSVTVSPKADEVMVRKTITLTATVLPANATNKKVTWTSSNTAVATVDDNGNVRGVSEGTVTITAAAGGKSDTATVTVIANPNPVAHYVIVSDGYALSTARSSNTAQGGSSSYTYTGLSGVAYTSGSVASDDIRWIFEETDGGYYIMSLDGKYLNATYTSGSNSGQGDLKLDSTKDVWVLDDGVTFVNGTVESSKLKSTNATASTPDKPKYLGYEESPANLFTVRSNDNADEVSISEASDPVAATGVTLNKDTITLEAKKSETLIATVQPEDATNKNVTWSSSNEAVAKVDSTGKVRGVAEGTAVITVTTADGGHTATCTVNVTPSTATEKTYVITVGSFALSTATTTDTLSNNSGAYVYSGLAGAAFDPNEDPADEISWILEEVDGVENGYYIKSLDGRYLNATYTSASSPSSSNPTRGVLKLDDTPDVWVMDGSLESWEIDGSMLKSTNASKTASSDKFLAYEEKDSDSSNANTISLFTIRSESNADETTLVDPTATITVTFVETDSFKDGKEYIIAVTKDATSVYAVRNASGTSSGNTDSVTLTVTPASGSDPAHIDEVDEGAIWTYTSSNNYLTNNSRYLGYDSSSYVPRASGSARAITYTSGNKLQIAARYLTCDNGTFGTSTSSSSGAAVRLFVKTVEIVTCEHTWNDGVITTEPTCTVAGVKTFTCTKCGETKTEAVEALGHDYQDVVTAPACETQGFTTHTCSRCGDHYVDTYVDALGHAWELVGFTWTGNVAKNRAVDGVSASAEFRCTRECGVENEVLDADVTGPENGLYTATVVGPDGVTYTNQRAQAASGEYNFKFISSKTDAKPGDTIDFQLVLERVDHLASLMMYIVIGEGLTYKSGTLDKSSEIESEGMIIDLNEPDLLVMGYKYGSDLVTTADKVVVTFSCTVDEGFSGTASVTLDKETWEIYDNNLVDYTAQYDVTPGTVTVTPLTITFNANEGAGTMAAQTVYKNNAANLTKNTFTRTGYEFNCWNTAADGTGTAYADEDEVTLQAGITLYAQWNAVNYTIAFKNDDGTTLETKQVAYGTVPTYTGTTPTKAQTAQYTYTFSGWKEGNNTYTGALPAVTGDTTYTAVFTETVRTYTITWKNDDGTTLEIDENVPYGETPSYDGATPTKPATAQYTYTFNGWDPTPSAVSGDATYTATYTTSTNAYKVSGSIASWIATGHEGGTITIELIPDASGEQKLTATASGTTATYEFTEVPVGTYTLKVSKADHATRTYVVAVESGAVTQNVELNLLGDINGDGKVTAIDLSMADWFLRSQKDPTDYQRACADVNEDGQISTVDLALINSHVKKASLLWDALTAQP